MAERHSSGSQIGEPCLTVVKAIEQRPRRGIPELLTITAEMDSNGIAVLKHAAADILARNPRYPVHVSVPTGCCSPDVIEILKRAELVSDKGLADLLKKAAELVKEHPHTTTPATILRMVRKEGGAA